MKTARVSFTLPQDLLDEARTLVGDGNLSAYITQGLERQLRADRLARNLCCTRPVVPDVRGRMTSAIIKGEIIRASPISFLCRPH